jgi:hypothetical protein
LRGGDLGDIEDMGEEDVAQAQEQTNLMGAGRRRGFLDSFQLVSSRQDVIFRTTDRPLPCS